MRSSDSGTASRFEPDDAPAASLLRSLTSRTSVPEEAGASPEVGFVSAAASSIAPAGPRRVLRDGELFLGGNYIELGLSNVGSFGTLGGKPDGFIGGNPPGGHPNSVGLNYDVDGFGSGTDASLDFYVPDTPEERWSVGYNHTRNAGFSALAGTGGNAATLTDVSVRDRSVGNTLSGTSTATVDGVLKVVQTHSFGVNDSFYKTTVTLTNVSGSTLENVEFMRSFDPDGTRSVGGDNSTVNTVGGQYATEGYSLVTAASLEGDAYDVLTGSRAVIFFFSRDPNASVYTGGFTNSDPYSFDDVDQSTGYTRTADDAIGILFEVGDLAPGQSVTVTYYTGATTEDDPNLIEEETDSGIENFFGHLNDGVSLAGFFDEVVTFFDRSLKDAVRGTIFTVGGFVLGIRDIIVGKASGDYGQELSGLIDASSAVVATVSAPISIAAQLAKWYAGFWVPITHADQDEFLNFIARCVADKDLNDLSSSQQQQILDRYSGGWGLANLLSDHSRYKTRGIAAVFGQTGCP